jgi:hypothetical protein
VQGDLVLGPLTSDVTTQPLSGFALPPGLSGTYMAVLNVNCPTGTGGGSPGVVPPPFVSGTALVFGGTTNNVWCTAVGSSPPLPGTSPGLIGTQLQGPTGAPTSVLQTWVFIFTASPVQANVSTQVLLGANVWSSGSSWSGFATGTALGMDLVVTALSVNM